MSLPVALDAMGGDHGALPNVEGAVQAARAGVPVILVGDRVKLHAELGRHAGSASLPIEVVEATDVIGMDEHASDVRSRTQASINVASRLVKESRASAVVSMGHSGATMASALLTLGRIKGVERPAILTHLPAKGGFTTLLDAGANADVKATYYAQWARLASVYLKVVEDRDNPTVGLLSIGEEDHKGSALVLEAHGLLRALHGRGVNFHGNVEGRDIFRNTTDIVVTDGFTGNVVLKLAEGEAKVLFGWVKEALQSSLKSKLGGLLVRGALRGLAERMDPSTYGASLLIGVRGLAFIGHGSADARAVKNALLRAARAHEANLIPRLEAAFTEQQASS
ncbi:phosphate acyltransferase PlsX [Deinococcus soli (ex Cha et al. 2016)]|uniref:Phosphate acyltransferase n=2 Tax=Deinococcus soli (ex Cha et al. 2016) TaxID=1309411 RepID=A0AAE3XF83_9DEIO|nr:phosphate acyltransferase PlsX [Deinococcus soli (ex Cha et al. 2016)]MDR6219414.1 glycerol-3-phosphate acyltransferase PlsX [Deinococcus soli (ex Cha et al. 2016)]MDR6327093.1 glycerol-3-phosphate acyltransferase PlsX [Deinococcus soli (ex Cha et al. 2016)]MDR6752441.1 glycerol-3-phosphate acyltransferase PlsX [Deinococcus soli (ex Cha et al. 2016)]